MENSISFSKKWLILIITSLSTFMATLDSSIVNIALPDMSKELHVTISSIQWVVTSYLLTISLLLLVFGKLSDLFGKKKIFASGFVVFALGSALCAFSHSLTFLVAARVVQALGASAMMSLSQGIVTGTFPPEERGRALGLVGTMVALGSLVGPSLGGVLVSAFNWQSIFYINIPIGVIGSVLAICIIPEVFETQKNKYFDIKGTAFFSVALLIFFLSLLLVQQGFVGAIYLIPCIAVSALLLLLFIATEKSSPNPLISLRLFRIHEFSFGLCAAFLSFIAINSSLLFMPFYLQDVMGFGELKSGLIISVYPITTAFAAPFSGWLSDRITYRPLTIIGMLTASVSLLLLATLGAASPLWEIIVLLVLLGLGTATFQSPNNSSIMGSVERRELGIAGGINALFRNLGLVTGTTLSVLIFSFATRVSFNALSNGGISNDIFMHGFSLIMLFDAICTIAAAVISITRSVKCKQLPSGDEEC